MFKALVIFMIGEYGARLPAAPYIIEQLVDSYTDETSADVKLSLLTAAMSLFFCRAGEMQRILGRLFSLALNDFSSFDVHDKALLYYRLLQADVDVTSSLFSTPKPASRLDMTVAHPQQRGPAGAAFFAELNSLSVVYSLPASHFIEAQQRHSVTSQ